eukprot:scaffold42555_cov70-Cyclotella_meneghiniana.AAC.3
MKSSTISFIGILASTKWQSSSGFAIPSTGVQRSSSLHALNNDNTSCDRLTFLTTIATAAMASPLVAYADGGFEDLSMPSADEQKAQNAAMEERLRKKAELQAQARRPMGYAESVEAERRKQKGLEKTKEEKRAAMCEELGRGC